VLLTIRESLLSILDAQQISCEKQDRILFQDIDLSINSGELVLLTGENGAGKTSLLRILVGLSRPSMGQVFINGQAVSRDVNLATAGIVYVGHKLGLSGLLSPLENLQFYMRLIGRPCQHSNEILEVLCLLGLDGLEDLPLKYLSAGQQRRVSLARLWLNKSANLWVLDEPFTALDLATITLVEKHIEGFLNQHSEERERDIKASAFTDGEIDNPASKGAVLMTSHQATNINHQQTVFDLEFAW
jgi:heme exporter protein A